MGLFDNFSGSPLTASNPQFSAVQKPDFSISLDIGKSSGFGQGLFPQPTFGETKPQTQAEWAKQQFSNRLDQQAQDFHSNLQNIINPQKKDFDPTKWGMTDYAQQFSDMAQPFLQQNKLRTGLMLQQSNDPGTQLLGKVQTDEAIADATKSLGLSTVNEKSFGDKFANSTFGKNFGLWSKGLDTVNTAFTGIFGEKSEYEGLKGNTARTLDSAYDTISDVIANVPVWGQAASLIMKGGRLLGGITNKLGGGTDGMCVCTGTKVFTSTGALVNIEDLQKQDGIIGWREKTKEIVPQTIHDFVEPRQKECLEIVLKNGYILRCSIDHPILSDVSSKAKPKYINGKRIAIRQWKFRRADELEVGNFVGLANNIDYWGQNSISNAYLIGLLIGDGTYSKGNSCRIISADPDTWEYLEKNNLGVLNYCDDSRPEKYNKEVRTYRIIDGMKLMRDLGLVYQVGKNKTLPKNIGEFDKTSVCQLLAGLFDTDGSISVNEDKESYSITLYQSNLPLLEEVRLQLHKLGIFSTIGTRKAAKYQLGGRVINSNESYRLEIHDISSAIAFYNLIPLNISYKKESLMRIYKMLKNKKPQEHNDISGAKQMKIISITPIGIQTVYNLQADNDHTYLAQCVITHNTTTDAIMGSAFMQLTPFGLINGFGGKKADTITKDNEAFETVGSSYTGTGSTVDDALTKSGKKYGLFSSGSREKANREIAEAKRQQKVMSEIADQATDRLTIRNSMSAINSNRRAFDMSGGYNQSAVRVGREGLSIQSILAAKRVVSALKFKTNPIKESVEESQPVVDSFQQGGVLELSLQDISEEYLEPMSTIEEVTLDSILPEFREGGKVNVIPEGALHARLHHMENAENLTKKGIPVVSEKEGGELEQQAEIERNEIIFRLEVTKKLEELLKKYSDDETPQKDKDTVAIEAGKLLVEEILNNTIDNTGLLTNIN